MSDPNWEWGTKNWTDDQLAGIRKWLKGKRQSNNATSARPSEEDEGDEDDLAVALRRLKRDPLNAAKYKKIGVETALLEIEKAAEEGALIPRREAEQEWTERIGAVKAWMHRAIKQLPVMLAMKTAEQIEPILTNEFKTGCNIYASKN